MNIDSQPPHTRKEKIKNVSYFVGLDVLSRWLKASPEAWKLFIQTSKKKYLQFFTWILLPPILASECAPSPGTKGGGGTLTIEGLGSLNSDNWRKSLALYLLCA